MANKIKVTIDGDSKGLKKELGKTQKQTKSWSQKMQGSFAGAGGAMAALGGAAAVGVLVKGVGAAINKAEEMNSLYAITETIIKDTGGAANVTASQVKDMAKEMAFNTGISKAAITEGTNLILTFKNIRTEAGEGNDIFRRTNELMLDMSTVMGTDAKGSAIQLGKALNDPITGVASLARVGVTFTTQQKEQIKTLQESGDLLGAQKVVLEELESQFAGTAEAAADDTAKIARGFDEITETIGQALIPALAKITPAVLKMVNTSLPAIEKLAEGVGGFAEESATAVTLLQDWSNLSWGDRIRLLNDPLRAAKENIHEAAEATGEWVDGMGALNKEEAILVQGHLADTAEQVAAAAHSAAQGIRDQETALRNNLGPFDTLLEKARTYATLVGGLGHLITLQELSEGPSFGGSRQTKLHQGGIVPGPRGQPVGITALGGEQVSTIPQQRQGGGGGVVVNISGFVGSELEVAEAIDQALTRRRASSGLEFQS